VPELESVGVSATKERDMLTAVDEYAGQSTIAVSATQLGTDFTQSQAAQVVRNWVEFFESGPSPIVELQLVSRTPKRLFNALAGQTQIERLFVKWGDYDDLAPIAALRSLRVLRLGGATRVRDVSPLVAVADTLVGLEIDSIRDVKDLSPLGTLSKLRQLELGGAWMSSRTAHIESIGWLEQLRSLEHLLLHTIVVDDLDYSPLLRLPRLQAVRVAQARGMTPPHDELRRLLPWAE
jgi:hypothetical protein